jgi:vancomycin aglycone glucosyltransferase
LKIAIVINGTRGDVQPMIALALACMAGGHEIVLCAPPENEELARQYQCPFVPFGPNYREIFKRKANMKGGQSVGPSPKEGKAETLKQIDLLPELIKGADLVLGVGLILGVHTVADLLKVPYRLVVFYPVLLGTAKTDPFFSRMMFGFGRSMINMLMKGFLNKKRMQLGLEPVDDVWAYWMGENVIIACDKALNPANDGVAFRFTQTGYMFLPSKNGLPASLETFLNAGKPPVYIGFGSIPISRPEKYATLFREVAKATGQRLLVSKGWADLPENNSDDILYVDDMPFELLFPRLAAVVFHGGTGTMAAAARAGIPQVAFPFMADQFDNSKRIIKMGLGPRACKFTQLSAESLVQAISECLANDQYKKNAVEMSQKLQDCNGLQMTLQLIEKEFSE